MKTITLTVTTGSNKNIETEFTIWPRAEREAAQAAGGSYVSREDWEDEDMAKFEKKAALAAGIAEGQGFYVKFAVK